jgi:hypothetical protein
MIRRKAMGNSIGMMESIIKATGKMVNKMEKEHFMRRVTNQSKQFGRKLNLPNYYNDLL